MVVIAGKLLVILGSCSAAVRATLTSRTIKWPFGQTGSTKWAKTDMSDARPTAKRLRRTRRGRPCD